MTKEQEILNYMKKLDISREEAEQLWEDDHEGYESPEMVEISLLSNSAAALGVGARTSATKSAIVKSVS